MNLNDADFLTWLADRLEHVYFESPNVDFVRRLRTMAERMMEMRLTPKDALVIERDGSEWANWVHEIANDFNAGFTMMTSHRFAAPLIPFLDALKKAQL